MGDMRLACFDLDDTLIRGIHSVMLPCILNGKENEHALIQEQEEKGMLDYKTADYQRAVLLNGLEERKIKQEFLTIVKPLKNIKVVVDTLHKHQMECIIITVGPSQVAKAACEIWGFDGYYGSEYEVVDGVFTGKILNYMNADQKVECLKAYCLEKRIEPQQCVAIGDGGTDIPVFQYSGKSIAINSSPMVREYATYAVDTEDLTDLLELLFSVE